MGFVRYLAFACIGFASLTAVHAKADLYRFSIFSADRSDLSAAINCLDYVACSETDHSINFDASRSHAWVELASDQLATQLAMRCFKEHARVQYIVRNDHTGVDLTFWVKNSHWNQFLITPPPRIKNIDVKELTSFEKDKLHETVSRYIEQKKFSAILPLVVKALEFETHGYRLWVDPTLKGYAITEHDTKSIRFSHDFFSEPCDIIRAIRHELEHATQWTHATACKTLAKKSSLLEHLHRERLAHLNDIRNLDRYCPKQDRIDFIARFSWNRIQSNYLKH
jgi:hypothetical protein